MMLGHIGFSTCTGCRAPGECIPHSACMAHCGAIHHTEQGQMGQLRYVASKPAQGWECPRCQVIHAPTVQRCTCTGAGRAAPVYQD